MTVVAAVRTAAADRAVGLYIDCAYVANGNPTH